MERRELFKKFVKKEIGHPIFEFMRISMVYRNILSDICGCSQKEVDDLILEIQQETSDLLVEYASCGESIVGLQNHILTQLKHRWCDLSKLSVSSAEIYLDDIQHKDNLPRICHNEQKRFFVLNDDDDPFFS